MIVLGECGNSTVKLAQAGQRWRCALAEALAWAERAAEATLVLAATAAEPGRALRAAWRGPVLEAGRELPLPDVGQYPGIGLDRVLAGLAAGGDAIVVDAGTATTLTAWDARGRCLGGLILPGRRAMSAGLAACAPALPRLDTLPAPAAACQRDPAGAIAAGIAIGHPAMVAACLERLRRETGCARTLLTGGEAESLPLSGERRPWLVLEGLELLARRRGLPLTP
ncbi:MAG: type III pantothenate kinase [Planctomycetota bacterium]|nr:type III pantothenate kinase [Planctomycetota bacterium]MCX8040295.1 type III pantothenate kinase [Planctomycetota bacterium]MDW8372410.1 type III pantothenate kinase [Planctomycetota bacterium]